MAIDNKKSAGSVFNLVCKIVIFAAAILLFVALCLSGSSDRLLICWSPLVAAYALLLRCCCLSAISLFYFQKSIIVLRNIKALLPALSLWR